MSDDVVIVGAGASGGAAAWRLAKAGFSVTCLEQGDWVSYEDTPSFYNDWEVARQTTHHPNPNVRGNRVDYPVDDSEAAIKPFLYNAVGGSTILWGAHFPRFRPSDFRVRSLDGVADDWPIAYEDLAPFYEENDRMVGVSGLAGDPGNPPRDARQMPPVPPGPGGERMAAAFDRLGWHWWPTDVAINTRPYGEDRGTCNNCGPCDLGCPLGARSSSDVTYWRAAVKAGVRLITGARSFEIETDARGRATGVAYYDRDGKAQRHRANVVALAANGLGTARLMLLSTSRRFPNGLANDSDLVGRRLMHHPTGMVTARFDERMDGYRGPFAVSILSQQFYETDAARDFVRGYQMQLIRSDGPVGTACGGYLPRVPWGRRHHQTFRDTFAHTASLTVTTEDLPRPENRVTLSETLKDAWGIPAPKMTYALDDNTKRMIEHGIGSATRAFEEAGAVEISAQRLVANAGFHLLGTACMGADPETSVVDAACRAHAVPNLLVLDGSVFTTAAALNPTSTIQALALRAADLLVRERRDVEAAA
ncbi:GMC family oxidoreductase [Neoaquamicrobium sediminum]|uniref:GMC family oxidoreductase n=1 Tax=Neoaquamicrobium sediminum TaxID=1849104 RepID=UPI003BAD937E